MTKITQEALDIARSAERLKSDINGNPRYYISCIHFADDGDAPLGNRMYRPAFANKYRGKKYGAGWVFQSYYLADDVQCALNERASKVS